MSETIERRPFHETIVDVLKECVTTRSGRELGILLQLLSSTKIPENHDAIIAAWKGFVSREYRPYESYGASDGLHRIVDDLEEQKREAEAEVHRRAEAEERALYGDDDVCDRSI